MKLLLCLLLTLHCHLLQGQTCLDFENFALGTTTSASQGSISFGTTFIAKPVILPSGATIPIGGVSVGNSLAALNSGQALNVNNAAVEFCLPGLKQVSFRFSNQGGYFNFSVDDSKVEIPNNENSSFSINGVDVVITGTKPNNRLTGEITLTAQNGTFGCFSVGGQELQIDDVCFLTCESPSSPNSAVSQVSCVEFESLDKQSPFPIESAYNEAGLVFKIKDHEKNFGQATSSTLRLAGHLGQEFHFEDAGFAIGADCWSSLNFNFYTKDSVEVTVNGISRTAPNISSLDGLTFGDVSVMIKDDPDRSGAGVASFVGRIEAFEISGADFHLDHFCVASCLNDCIDFEGEEVGAKYNKGSIINEDGYALTILDPQSNNEPALLSTDNEALGSGKELQLNDGSISFGKSCFRGLAFQYGQFVDGISLEIDGDEITVPKISDLNGMTVGGMTIEVYVTQAFGNRERGVVRMNGASGAIGMLARGLSIDRVCIDECPDPLVIGFSEEPLGEVFNNGEAFTEDGIEITVRKLRSNDAGQATIIGSSETGGEGQAIQLDFATLQFDLLCASQLTFQFANFGANGGPQGFGTDVRLDINGVNSGLIQNFTPLDGTSLGDVDVQVTTDGNSGRVTLTGNIESVIIGGFNLQIDNLMQTPFVGGPNRHDFTTWDSALTYGPLNESLIFLSDGSAAFFQGFQTVDSQFINGTATIGSDQNAGGSGRELTLRDSTVFVELLGTWADVSFRFQDLGLTGKREFSLDVNGDTFTYNHITELDGQVFRAGTSQEVTARVLTQIRDGKVSGIVKLEGYVAYLTIGGRGHAIDNLRGTRQPAPIMLGSSIVSVERTGPNEITYVWDIEAINVQNSDFLIRRSNLLTAQFASYSGSTPQVLSHGGGGNLYRVTKTEPIAEISRFYRVELRAN